MATPAVNLRVATCELIHSMHPFGLKSHSLGSLIDQVLNQPQSIDPQNLRSRIIACLKPTFLGRILLPENSMAMQVFLKALGKFLEPSAQKIVREISLGAGVNVPEIQIQLDTTHDRLDTSWLGELSDEAKKEVAAYYATGKTDFSPGNLLEILSEARRLHLRSLEAVIHDRIVELLRLDPNTEQFFTLYEFADTHDEKLKTLLFSMRPHDFVDSTAGKVFETFEEIDIYERLHQRQEYEPLNLTHCLSICSEESLWLLERAFLENCDMDFLELKVATPILASNLSKILLKYLPYSNIKWLDLHIDDEETFAHLIPPISTPKITRLSLTCKEGCFPKTLPDLKENHTLRSLHVTYYGTPTKEEVDSMTQFVRSFSDLTLLNFLRLESAPMHSFLESLLDKKMLRDVTLYFKMDPIALDLMAQVIERNPALCSLEFSIDVSSIDITLIRKIARAFRNSHLHDLEIGFPQFHPCIEPIFTEGVAPCLTLKRFKPVFWDKKSPIEARCLSQMARTLKSVETLDLSEVLFDDEGGEMFMRGVGENSSISTLTMDGTSLGIKTIQQLSSILILEKTPLRYLSLRTNQLTDEHLEILGEGLARNITLYSVNLSGNSFTFSGLKKLASQLQTNLKLMHVIFDMKVTDEEMEQLKTHFDQSGFSISVNPYLQIMRKYKP